MPEAALEIVNVDHVAPVRGLGPLIARLVAEPVVPLADRKTASLVEPDEVQGPMEVRMREVEDWTGGHPSRLVCPECNGSLTESQEGGLLRYRCHVGHAFSASSMAALQGEALERALWAAVRSLEEAGALARRLARHARGEDRSALVRVYEQRAGEKDRQAGVIREMLVRSTGAAALPPAREAD